MTPKISVLVPMYNRKHYIKQCLDSALAQTFQDFEIIVRDDGSTDGSFDFVAQRYADQISSGKIKLRRNEKNLGEQSTSNRLILEASGKYFMILHSDDMYVPHALQHMYEVAEKYQADVVHASKLWSSSPDGVLEQGKPIYLACWESNPADEIKVMPADTPARFKEYITGGTFVDTMHNIFRRRFFAENNLHFETFEGHGFLLLHWILKAKVYVKTPEPIYIYRRSPDSLTNKKLPLESVSKLISNEIKLSRHLDEFFAAEDFFKDKPELQYLVRSRFFSGTSSWDITRREVYRDGVTPELNRAVEAAFRKHFGDSAAYLAFLFHYAHAAQAGHSADKLNPPPEY